MEILEQSADRVLTLTFSGELDHHRAKKAMRQVDRAMDAALPRSVILDFSGLTFMDSSGIALILRARHRMELLEGTLTLRSVPPQAGRVLNAAGIGRLVRITD